MHFSWEALPFISGELFRGPIRANNNNWGSVLRAVAQYSYQDGGRWERRETETMRDRERKRQTEKYD